MLWLLTEPIVIVIEVKVLSWERRVCHLPSVTVRATYFTELTANTIELDGPQYSLDSVMGKTGKSSSEN